MAIRSSLFKVDNKILIETVNFETIVKNLKGKTMPVAFKDLCEAQSITRYASFEDIAQACIEAYYLAPYPDQKDVSQDKRAVNRRLHGGVHAARTALCAELFIEVYKKYAPELVVNAQGKSLTDNDIKLLKLAAVYHDSANISETIGHPQAHSENFARDMKLLGYEEYEIEPFARAILNKDVNHSDLSKDFFAKIIHDADCLEIIRCTHTFYKKYLDVYQYLTLSENFHSFEMELDQIIKNHTYIIEMMAGKFHLQCEFSKNCYIELKSLINMLFTAAKSEKASKLSNVNENENEFTLFDLYNREYSDQFDVAVAKALYKNQVTLYSRQVERIFGPHNALNDASIVLQRLIQRKNNQGASALTLKAIQDGKANVNVSVIKEFDVQEARKYYQNRVPFGCRFFTTQLDQLFGTKEAPKTCEEVLIGLKKRVPNAGASLATLLHLSEQDKCVKKILGLT